MTDDAEADPRPAGSDVTTGTDAAQADPEVVDDANAETRRQAAWRAGLSRAAQLGVTVGGRARRTGRRRSAPSDPYSDVDFKSLYDDEPSIIVVDDGTSLAVRTVDPPGDSDDPPELTVIFVHGFALRLAAWHFQRYQLAERWADRRIRMVFYDHRGHGRSDPAAADTSTTAQLADDIAAVMRVVAPKGPVVLVGHSMGGMAIMGLARRQPQLFGPAGQVAGVALVATAARGIAEAGLGEALRNPVVDALRVSVRFVPGLVKAGRGVTRQIVEPVLVAAAFGPDFHSPALGHAVESMIQNTRLSTLINFLAALEHHDESTALPVIAQVPSVVVGATDDQLTPLHNSVQIYSKLGRDSRLVVAENCGHMVPMEEPELVTEAIAGLVDRARSARPRPRMRWRGGRARR